MSKNSLLSLAAATALLCTASGASADVVQIYRNGDANGPAAEHNLTTGTTIVFSADAATVKQSGSTLSSHALSAMQTIRFASGTSAIGTVAAPSAYKLAETVVSSSLAILGPTVAEGTPVAIYSVSGATVASIPAWKGESIDVATLASGVYVATVKNQSLKFVKK